jgi:hypothetical protein
VLVQFTFCFCFFLPVALLARFYCLFTCSWLFLQYAPGGGAQDNSTARMREDLALRWNELKTPLADRVDCLSALLDAAPAAPEMVARYEGIVEKLAARQPIAQVLAACMCAYQMPTRAAVQGKCVLGFTLVAVPLLQILFTRTFSNRCTFFIHMHLSTLPFCQ